MNQVVIFNNKTAARDKLARLIQYASKVIWHLLERCNASGTSIDKIKNLEYILGNFRRLLRLGRCLDTLYVASSLMKHEDFLVSFNCAVSKISYSMFLLCDHLIWLGRCGLADVDTVRWNRIANKYWLFTILFNLIRDYVEIKRVLAASSASTYKQTPRTPPSPRVIRNFLCFAETHKDIVLDTVKNGCDIFIPLAALNYIELSPSTIGLLGVVSSIAGIYAMFDPFAKLPLT